MEPLNGQGPSHDNEAVTAIHDVIRRQLDAFQRDAAEEAFCFASPGIRQTFGSAENFLLMVQANYPAVYRPQSVEFRDVYVVQGEGRQVVALVGPDGVPVLAVYHVQRQTDGQWLINGCVVN